MSNWFIITSACNVDYGIYSLEQKFHQTCLTIDSIRKYCPDNKIIILEASPISLPNNKRNFLHWAADVYVDMSADEKIQWMHKELNTFAIKSPSEVYILGSFLEAQNFIKETDRVFKISGRYILTDKFDLTKHQEKNKYTFKTKEQSVTYYKEGTQEEYPKYTDYQYKTRLYSFCGSLIPYHSNKCLEMFEFFTQIYGKTFTDLEHAMYKFLDHNLVTEIETIGLAGYMVDREGRIEE